VGGNLLKETSRVGGFFLIQLARVQFSSVGEGEGDVCHLSNSNVLER